MENNKQTGIKVISALNELKQLYEILITDVRECADALQQQDTEFRRRIFVRSVFAFIEAVVFRLKQLALEASNELSVELSISETALLSEESYELTEKGDPYTKTNHLQLPKNTRFAFKAVAQVFSSEYKLKIDNSGWASFLDAIKIRNRLTHPKTIGDTSVSDQELDVVSKALLWFTNSELELVKEARTATQDKMNWTINSE
jgi:hypothetical protein